MLDHHISLLRRASRKAQAAIDDELARQARFSLTALINARMRHPAEATDPRALDAAFALDAACRAASGQAPSGTWVPLGALLATRDLTASGSALVSAKVGSTLEDTLRPASAVIGAGAVVIAGLNAGNLLLPAIDSPLDAAGAWVSSEGTTFLQAEPSFRQVTVAPYQLGVEIRISRRLLHNATPAIEAALRAEIARAFMQALDRACLIGQAANNQPDGLLTLPSVPVVSGGANGAAPSWSNLVEMERTVAAANGSLAAGAWLTNGSVVAKLRRTQRASGLDFILAGESQLLGHPLRSSGLVPSNFTKGTSAGVCSALLFGDFSQAIVAFWGPAAVDLVVDDVTRAKDGLVRLVARADVGFGVRNPAAFVTMTDLLTS
jgi:HK97 family phage major capsid protein